MTPYVAPAPSGLTRTRLFLAAATALVSSLLFLAAFVVGMLGAGPALAILAGALGGLLFATSLVCFVLALTREAR